MNALFPATRQDILATLLLEPSRSWYLSDLTAHLGRPHPSSLQRELDSLVAAGILLHHREGNRVYFQANRDCPIYPELVSLFNKTAGLTAVARQALMPLASRIRIAFIHGSVARRQEQATSDADLLIVGVVGLSDVSPALRVAENELGREINASIYSPAEFTSKVAAGHHFLSTVLKREKIFLIGSENDLAELIAGGESAAARYQ